MAKVSGSTLEFWYGGVEYPVNSVTFDGSWDEIDTTDSATATPATEFITNRSKRTSKVEADLADVDGAEKTSGSLTLGSRYKVTGGSITETVVSHVYPSGDVFMSDGTGTCNATNKVKPLGAKLPGKNASATIASVSTAVVSFKFTESYGEFDATDTGTSGDGTEFIVGRAKRTSSIEVIMQDTVADLLTNNPTAVAVVLTLGSGLTITGNAIFTKKGINSIAKGDMVKVAYDMSWVGSVTITLANLLAMGASTATIIRWKGWGTTTQKQVSGNAIVIGRTFEMDVNSIAKVSYDLDWVGQPTEAVYS
jgi:hypothetical protein